MRNPTVSTPSNQFLYGLHYTALEGGIFDWLQIRTFRCFFHMEPPLPYENLDA